MMLWIKALHIISMVAWFAGLFYLPRLFVYHTESFDAVSQARFKLMERRLYYGITWPAALATTFFGIVLVYANPVYYQSVFWFQLKFLMVVLVWIFHGVCGYFLREFQTGGQMKSALFFRFFNEIPTVLLVIIVILAVVKPL